jgi:beta-phosphoglucomutase
MLHGLVLDFDGVVVDSEPVHLRASQAVLAGRGIELPADDYYGRYVGLDDATMFARIGEDCGCPLEPWLDEILREKSDRVASWTSQGTAFFPGVPEHIRELARTAPIAIASGAVRPEIERALDEARLTDVVRVIVAAGDTPRGKPYADPYRRAVALLGQQKGCLLDPARVVAVEDTLRGLQSAATAGLRTIAVTTTFPAGVMHRADLVVRSLVSITPRMLEDVVQASAVDDAADAAAG